MKPLLPLLLLCLFSYTNPPGGYDGRFVEIKTLTFGGELYGVIKMKRSGLRVKAKYFASNVNNTNVADRYTSWAANKSVITYSSGTYMNACTIGASPVGLCVDQGTIINNVLETDKLDGLVIVYPNGGLAVSNLKDGNLNVQDQAGTKMKLNIRGNSYDLATFGKWAQQQEATVFQTHLFAYKDQLLVNTNGSPNRAERRFLAVCNAGKDQSGNDVIVHYIVNLPAACTVYDGAKKAFNYLKNSEDVDQVIFMINLDTGCQDIFALYDARGGEVTARHFQGDNRIPLNKAANMLAYYFE
jgi:hypothetical protein